MVKVVAKRPGGPGSKRQWSTTELLLAVSSVLIVILLYMLVASSSSGYHDGVMGQMASQSPLLRLPNNLSSSSPIPKKKSSRFSTTATRCKKKDVKTELNRATYSQTKEDIDLLQWFNGICNGRYMEMGALNGVHLSNTFVFHKEFDWKGVLVELATESFKMLQNMRRDELATVNAAVCDTAQTIHYVDMPQMGGIWEYAAQSFRDQWWPNMTMEHNTTEIECRPLQDILDEVDAFKAQETIYFDFFSLDIEGAEFDALRTLNFERTAFGILLIEADEHNELKNSAIRTLLQRHGYYYLHRKSRSDWFIHGDFDLIYKDLLHEP